MNPTLAAALAALRENYTFTPWQGETRLPPQLAPHLLARTADCAAPDKGEDDGAQFLTGLFEEFERHVTDELRIGAEDTADTLRDILADADWCETADSAVPVYTHPKWQTFTQLQAYQEELDPVPSDLTNAAQAALYQVADRLLRALADELADLCEDREHWSDHAAEIDPTSP